MNRIQEFLKRKGIEDKIVDYDESNEPFTPSYIIQEWEKEQLRIGGVVGRSEQLKAFVEWQIKGNCPYNGMLIDEHIKEYFKSL